jgi:hypothetical protein
MGAISERQCTPQIRSISDEYFRFLSPALADAYGADFPRTVRYHSVDKTRSRDGGSTGNLLCFYMGDAILAYYDLVKYTRPVKGKDIDPQVSGKLLAALISKVEFLETIQKKNFQNFSVDGDDEVGYRLFHKSMGKTTEEIKEAKAQERKEKQEHRRKEQEARAAKGIKEPTEEIPSDSETPANS